MQTRYVVASNIFNDLSAEVESLALAVDQLDTEDHIPNGTVPGSGRSGQVARECSAQSGYAIEQWWLKREALTLGCKDRNNIDQWSAGPCRDNQLLRLVVHNAPVFGNVQHSVVTVATHQVLLAASTIDIDRTAGLACLLQCIDNLLTAVSALKWAVLVSHADAGPGVLYIPGSVSK